MLALSDAATDGLVAVVVAVVVATLGGIGWLIRQWWVTWRADQAKIGDKLDKVQSDTTAIRTAQEIQAVRVGTVSRRADEAHELARKALGVALGAEADATRANDRIDTMTGTLG